MTTRRRGRIPTAGTLETTQTDRAGAARRAPSWTPPATKAALFTTLGKVAIWGMLGCGPLALITAAVASPNPASTATSTGPPARSPLAPAGWAELYVAAYLQAGDNSTAVQQFFPAAPPSLRSAGRRQAARTVTVAASEVNPGYWSVTVAADVMDTSGPTTKSAGVHYFMVPVLALGGPESGGTGAAGRRPGFVATALPAEVAAPSVSGAPELGYDGTTPITRGPLQDTISQFLNAYLAGSGDLGRYLSPSTQLHPVTPAPYRSVQVTSINAKGQLADADSSVPADGTVTHVLATVDAVDSAQQRWPLTYALALTARAGRWEVTRMQNAPALAPSTDPRTSPPITSPSPDTPATSSPAAPVPETPAPNPTPPPATDPTQPPTSP